MLRKINESKGNVSESIAQLEAELAPLKQQRMELITIVKAMQINTQDNAT